MNICRADNEAEYSAGGGRSGRPPIHHRTTISADNKCRRRGGWAISCLPGRRGRRGGRRPANRRLHRRHRSAALMSRPRHTARCSTTGTGSRDGGPGRDRHRRTRGGHCRTRDRHCRTRDRHRRTASGGPGSASGGPGTDCRRTAVCDLKQFIKKLNPNRNKRCVGLGALRCERLVT